MNRAVLNSEFIAFGKYARSYFPSITVASFVEFGYQSNYTRPPVVTSSSDSSQSTSTTSPVVSWAASGSSIKRYKELSQKYVNID